MTDAQLIASLTPLEITTLTLWGEARGERIEGRVAVACVIRNRVNAKRFGKDYTAVCLAPYQFSCWLYHDDAHKQNFGTLVLAARQVKRDEHTPMLKECQWIAGGVIGNHLLDTVRDSTHYMTRALWESKPPKWSLGLTPAIGIGNHVFFNEVS
jgi:N-acetylmuramoyl-L-alanine amidase